MPSIDSVSFDDANLRLQSQDSHTRVWFTPAGDGVGLYFIPLKPDIQADLSSLESTRRACRSSSGAGGAAIIEVETPIVDGCRCLRQVIKYAQQPHGTTYIGSLTIPFRDFSFVVKVQCQERGLTGIREAVILDEAMATGQVTLGAGGHRIEGWARDPYDASLQDGFLWNISEAPEYDARFPEHPLSRARAVLEHLVESLTVSEDARGLPRFVFSA